MSVTSETGLGKSGVGSPPPAIFSNSASTAMKMVERAAGEVAPTDLPVFIIGESGTGKGTLATMIHRLSRRWDQELVKLNYQNLPLSLATDESAGRSPLGLSARQMRGTVLLDDVLQIPRVLQSQVMAILPDGDTEPHINKGNPRVIAAARSEDGRPLSGSPISRELYYRGVLLRIPPLRERREDIPLLAQFLLTKYAASFGRTSLRLSHRVEDQFQQHSWPGNVRELENAIKTLLAVDDETLVLESIGFAIAAGWNGGHLQTNGSRNGFVSSDTSLSLKEASRIASRSAEKQLIREVLQRTSWNRKRAAKELNISYKALLYKLKQNGLNEPGDEEPTGTGRGTSK